MNQESHDNPAVAEQPNDFHPVAAGRSPRGRLETVTMLFLAFGGIVLPVVGWVTGVVLMWNSRSWTRRQKLAGTLIVLLGAAAASGVMVVGGASIGPIEGVGVAPVIASPFAALYLLWGLRVRRVHA